MQRRQFLGGIAAGALARAAGFQIPPDYLREPETIPGFWVSAFTEVERFVASKVHTGTAEVIGRSAGGRAVHAVFYGRPRRGGGTTTYSGSMGFGDMRAYLGPDFAKKVYLGIAGVHGAEFEGIAGMCNLISAIETGKDLRGKAWPALQSVARSLDRVILIPVMNPDGRSRVPVRMLIPRGTDHTVPEYLNTGGKTDGSLIGWPQCKQFIPLDFSTVQFPGGYPNDAGVNIQHDDFFGARQPETQALFDLAARERPDVSLNMHTGAVFPVMLRSFIEPRVAKEFSVLYTRVMTGLTEAGLEKTRDAAAESRLEGDSLQPFNLDTALSLHCGSVSALIESPSHAYSTAERDGKPVNFTPDQLIDAQLVCHQEAMRFLADTGGRARSGRA